MLRTQAQRTQLLRSEFLRGENIEDVSGCAAQDILGLIPEEREVLELQEIRLNEGRAGHDAAWDVGPLTTVVAAGDEGGIGADSRDEGFVAGRVCAKDKADDVPDGFGTVEVRQMLVEPVLIHGIFLQGPTMAPDERGMNPGAFFEFVIDVCDILWIRHAEGVGSGASGANGLVGSGQFSNGRLEAWITDGTQSARQRAAEAAAEVGGVD